MIKLSLVMAQMEEVFGVSPERFNAMSDEERLRLTKIAAGIALDVVDQAFEETSADWVVVGQVPPRVLLSGDRSEPLDDDMIDQLAAEHGVVPFAFTHPENITSLSS